MRRNSTEDPANLSHLQLHRGVACRRFDPGQLPVTLVPDKILSLFQLFIANLSRPGHWGRECVEVFMILVAKDDADQVVVIFVVNEKSSGKFDTRKHGSLHGKTCSAVHLQEGKHSLTLMYLVCLNRRAILKRANIGFWKRFDNDNTQSERCQCRLPCHRGALGLAPLVEWEIHETT